MSVRANSGFAFLFVYRTLELGPRSASVLHGREAVVGDAGGAGIRAADEAEAVGQQRQRGHTRRGGNVLESAEDGAVVDVEELEFPVVRAGECVLVVGQRHDGVHRAGVQREGVLERAVEEPHADVFPRAAEDALLRWPSGIAATV